MIQLIDEMPYNSVGFKATGEVTKDDYEKIVYPACESLVKRTGRLNYLMIIDTSIQEFTLGAWWKDMILGLKELTKWHRAAILTDSPALNTFTDVVGKFIPGEFRGFKKEELTKAITWVAAPSL